MGEYKDKSAGLGNELAGKAKRAVGEITGNAELYDEGMAQERKGQGQNLKGGVKGALGDKV